MTKRHDPWLRLRERLERRVPLDDPAGNIVNIDMMPDGTIRKALRDRTTKRAPPKRGSDRSQR